jgi:hypothetical protein
MGNRTWPMQRIPRLRQANFITGVALLVDGGGANIG